VADQGRDQAGLGLRKAKTIWEGAFGVAKPTVWPSTRCLDARQDDELETA
jgi:hypothetical protein